VVGGVRAGARRERIERRIVGEVRARDRELVDERRIGAADDLAVAVVLEDHDHDVIGRRQRGGALPDKHAAEPRNSGSKSDRPVPGAAHAAIVRGRAVARRDVSTKSA
jgi:hypothetical protein